MKLARGATGCYEVRLVVASAEQITNKQSAAGARDANSQARVLLKAVLQFCQNVAPSQTN